MNTHVFKYQIITSPPLEGMQYFRIKRFRKGWVRMMKFKLLK